MLSLLPWSSCSVRWILPTQDLNAQQRIAVATSRESLLLLMTEFTVLVVFRVNQGTDKVFGFFNWKPLATKNLTHSQTLPTAVCYTALFCKSATRLQRVTSLNLSNSKPLPGSQDEALSCATCPSSHRCGLPGGPPRRAPSGPPARGCPHAPSHAALAPPTVLLRREASAANQKLREPRPGQWGRGEARPGERPAPCGRHFSGPSGHFRYLQ